MEGFQYNSFSESFCQQVLDVFRETKRIKAISGRLPISEASVFRLLSAAVDSGALSEEERDLTHQRRRVVCECLEHHPHATIASIAQLAGVSEATVYRTKQP